MVALTVFLALLAGSVLLCFSMPRHYRLVAGTPLPGSRKHAMRAAGYAFLLLGAWWAAATHGPAVGLAVAVGTLTVAVLATAFAVTALTRRQARAEKRPSRAQPRYR